ncbi:MAG: ABC transporter permease subunit [Halobellus sp.]|uniref:ABC transporter permease subunit n=1 Tax=Halobellus sp. TaxID=1979212 RepID=UPI0035D4CFAC
MSTLAVAKKDFRAARRSRVLWAVAVVLGMVGALQAYVSRGFDETPTAVVQELFRALTLTLAVLLPIVALVASYLAIAGEREGGGIKFLLSLPNTRRDVFVGKLLSRLGVVAAGVGFVYLGAISTALARHGAFPAGVVAGTLGLTLVYGSVFVSVAVSLSAAVAARSRAIAGAMASYFVLVVMYVVPLIQVPRMVRFVHTTLLGADPNPDLYNAVQYTSPFVAYRKAANLVVPTDLRRPIFTSSLPDDVAYGSSEANTVLPLYLQDEFSVVVLAVWLVVPPLVGYWLFERSDLE